MKEATLSLSEAARRIGKSKPTLKRYIESGNLPFIKYVKSGKKTNYIIPRDAFERFMRGELDGKRNDV